LRPSQNGTFCSISASGSNFNPRNIQYIHPKGTSCGAPVVEIFAFLELEQKLPFFKDLFLFCLMVRSAFNLIGNIKYQYTLLYLL